MPGHTNTLIVKSREGIASCIAILIAINECWLYHILSCSFCAEMCHCHYRASQLSIDSCEKGKTVDGSGLVRRASKKRESW